MDVLSGLIPDSAGEEGSAELAESVDMGEYSGGRNPVGDQSKIHFFSSTMFVFIILTTLLCTWIVEKKNMLIKIEIVILFYTIFALLDFFCGFIGMEIIGEQFWIEIYKFPKSTVQCMFFLIPRVAAMGFLMKWEEKSLVLKENRKILALLCVVF